MHHHHFFNRWVAATLSTGLTLTLLAGCEPKKPVTRAMPEASPTSMSALPSPVETPAPVVQPSVGLQKRFGDEIVVAGHFYRIGAPVLTWMDEGGYDAYRVERRFVPYEQSSWQATTQAIAAGKSELVRDAPARYNMRYSRAATQAYTLEELEQVRGGGWTLDLLQKKVDQFVLHYDVCGTSRQCFKVLHDARGLSVHFMLDIDGTLYQTLDLKERAWHATVSNDRSIGIEIANMGSYSLNESTATLQRWYKKDENGQTYITIPESLGGADAIRTKNITLRPARNEPVVGQIRGVTQRMYDLTPQQYDTLIKLTAALGDVFPQIKLDYPRGPDGKILLDTLGEADLANYKGVLGHFHVQNNKSDPGVALQWELLIDSARKELAARRANVAKK
jgi:N-acetylmuramoyl-L-alanine amidase